MKLKALNLLRVLVASSCFQKMQGRHTRTKNSYNQTHNLTDNQDRHFEHNRIAFFTQFDKLPAVSQLSLFTQ